MYNRDKCDACFYMIDNKVLFIPYKKKLMVVKDNSISKTIFINAPASRCLLLLLTNPQKIISRKDFIEEVWSRQGIVVAQNTYYQNISLLRKALRQAGLSEDFIVTVPHKGLTITRKIEVKEVEKEDEFIRNIDTLELTDPDRNLAHFPPEKSLLTKQSSDRASKVKNAHPCLLIFIAALVSFIITLTTHYLFSVNASCPIFGIGKNHIIPPSALTEYKNHRPYDLHEALKFILSSLD